MKFEIDRVATLCCSVQASPDSSPEQSHPQNPFPSTFASRHLSDLLKFLFRR